MFNKKRFNKQASKLQDQQNKTNLSILNAELDDVQYEVKITKNEDQNQVRHTKEEGYQTGKEKDVVEEALEN